MKSLTRWPLQRVVTALLLGVALTSANAQQGDAKRGEYLAKAGGCLGCHTEDKKDAVPFAGGRALKTPFGTFFGPNITPASAGRDREMDRGRFRPRDAPRPAPGRRQLFPGVPLPVVHED